MHTSLPASAGIGLRAPHHAEVLAQAKTLRQQVGWLEVHSENFFAEGGAAPQTLGRLRETFEISLHGVGLSLGGAHPLSHAHLRKLKSLVERIEPAAVSEHLCWSTLPGLTLNDLLPIPYSRAALDHVVARVMQVQDTLGRRILVENISSYVAFALPQQESMTEWDFLVALARRSGCGILLDVNNVYVSACNHGFDPNTYLAAIPAEWVGEIHLAGFESDESGLLVDTHSRPVSEAVWSLYDQTLARLGPKPTLIEWDNDIPALATLLREAQRAQTLLDELDESHVARAA